MSKVITFSKVFPKGHRREGQPTGFVKSILHKRGVLIDESYWMLLKDLNFDALQEKKLRIEDLMSFFEELKNEDEPHYEKLHTIRAGNRFEVGEMFSPRVWSGKPYWSPQIIFLPDLEVLSTHQFKKVGGDYFVNGRPFGYDYDSLAILSHNDCLSVWNFQSWFERPKGPYQIIAWEDVGIGKPYYKK